VVNRDETLVYIWLGSISLAFSLGQAPAHRAVICVVIRAEPGLGGPTESHVNRPLAGDADCLRGVAATKSPGAVLAHHSLLFPPAALFLSSSRAPLRMSAKP